MKIYFCGSILGGRDEAAIYPQIISDLKRYGSVLTEVNGRKDVVEIETKMSEEMENHTKFIHDQDLGWLRECDVVIAEVTQPSLGVGYEIGRAIEMGKPIFCLFREASGRHLSSMIDGAHNGDSFVVKYYAASEITDSIDKYMARFQKQ